MPSKSLLSFTIFFFNDTATTEIYTLSLHDALPIYVTNIYFRAVPYDWNIFLQKNHSRPESLSEAERQDRKSTRLNSSHSQISYAVFCLKKKKNTLIDSEPTRSKSISCYPRIARLVR